MKVYVVSFIFDQQLDDGQYVVRVFDSKEKAENFVNKGELINPTWGNVEHYETSRFIIDEFELE